jgi:hypothetical protein
MIQLLLLLHYSCFGRLDEIPKGQVGQSRLRRACNMNSVSPPITIVLHSFSPSGDDRFRKIWAASSLATAVLQPVMARRFFAPSVFGLLLNNAPPIYISRFEQTRIRKYMSSNLCSYDNIRRFFFVFSDLTLRRNVHT